MLVHLPSDFLFLRKPVGHLGPRFDIPTNCQNPIDQGSRPGTFSGILIFHGLSGRGLFEWLISTAAYRTAKHDNDGAKPTQTSGTELF